MSASNEALRSLQHERRNVVVRVRGCRMTKIYRNTGLSFCGMQIQQAIRFNDMLVSQVYDWAERKLSSKTDCEGEAALVQEVSRFP